jgi:hypothetical protein
MRGYVCWARCLGAGASVTDGLTDCLGLGLRGVACACATDSSSLISAPSVLARVWLSIGFWLGRGVRGPRRCGEMAEAERRSRGRRRPRIPRIRAYPGWRCIWIRGFIPLVAGAKTGGVLQAAPGPPPAVGVVPSLSVHSYSVLGMNWECGCVHPSPQGCHGDRRTAGCLLRWCLTTPVVCTPIFPGMLTARRPQGPCAG